jgi:hypothetical protein
VNNKGSATITEEVQHHRDVRSTPLWHIINYLSFIERLHTIALAVGGLRDPHAHLAEAVRLRLLKLSVYQQAFPVVEVLRAAMGRESKREDLTKMGEYGTEAVALWDRYQAHPAAKREHLLAVLWHLLPAGITTWSLDRLSFAPKLRDHLGPELFDAPAATQVRPPPAALLTSLARYWGARPQQAGRVLRSVAPLRVLSSIPCAAIRALTSPSPPAGQVESFDLPSLRSYSPFDGRRLHVDPLALASPNARSLGHDGIEEVITGDRLAVTIKACGLLIRHITLTCKTNLQRPEDTERGGALIESFVRRWALLSSGHHSLRDLATDLGRRTEIEAPARGQITARISGQSFLSTLEAAIDAVLTDPSNEAFRYADAYYLHGL